MTVALTRDNYDQISAHAVETFPSECCGIIVRRGGRQEVVRVTNVQDQMHARDPVTYERTSATAFLMGPEAEPVLLEHMRGSLVVEAFYHSHPQHDAYFSPTDRRNALVWDEPSYPDAGQVVISVYDRVVKDAKAFRWDAGERDFVTVDLKIDA